MNEIKIDPVLTFELLCEVINNWNDLCEDDDRGAMQ